ncbi:hypothetical protein ID866_9110 [Astraeus odoratus]|nr:hypothetical protein ID866_9110 [Astraeus odoratus]
MVDAASRDGQVLPLRCCQVLLPVDTLVKLLPRKQRKASRAQLVEASIPLAERVYCPTPTCSAFLGKAPNDISTRTCSTCKMHVCTGCKDTAHPGDDCKQNALALMVRRMAVENDWKTCPQCKVIVEHIGGCSNMTCRCGKKFCYVCGQSLPCRCYF